MAQFRLQNPWAAAPWAGFDELRREMDALLHRFGAPAPAAGRGAFPPVNLYETDEGYVVTAELPGVEPSDVSVTLEGNTLTLRGARRIEYPTEGVAVHRLERQSGSFGRSFDLPVAIDADKVEAVYRNGILMLRLPKAPEHQPRRIEVQPS